MIYILGKDEFDDYDGLDDVVVMASTKIDSILTYLHDEVNTNSLYCYKILVKPEDYEYGEAIIAPTKNAYMNFVNHTPALFLDEETEYEYIKNELLSWCDAIKFKIEKEEEERKKAFEKEKEKSERMLYEKLKAKYGN